MHVKPAPQSAKLSSLVFDSGVYHSFYMHPTATPALASAEILGSYRLGAYPRAAPRRAMQPKWESCRALYDELMEPSATRRNIDLLNALLKQVGDNRVLETNVICYSSPMSADLSESKHAGGSAAGKAVFRLLLDAIRPHVLIAHGAPSIGDLVDIVDFPLPPSANKLGVTASVKAGDMTIILLLSLAPPAWNRWQRWAHPLLQEAAMLAAHALA